MSRNLWLAAFCLAAAVPAHAQVQPNFYNLPDKVKPGQAIIVIDERGAEIRGKVEEVSGSKLVLNYGHGAIDPSLPTSRTFTPGEVQKVLKPGHLWDGAVKGAVIAVIPIIVLAASEDCFDCGWGQAAVTTGLIGAGIGVGIDALFGPKTVYRSNVRASRVSLAPILGRERKGVAASIRF